MRRFLLHALVPSSFLLLVAASGCDQSVPEDLPTNAPGGDVAEGEQAIINGSFDGENDAVCALMAESGQGLYPFCTGTVIKVDGSTGYAITAAHCLAPPQGTTPDYLVCTDTYAQCPGSTCKIYPVTATLVHPQYDGSPSYDVAMLTIGQATGAAVIPALAKDGLAKGAPLEFSGYGVTNGFDPQSPSSQADQRNHSFSVVGELYLDAIEAPQSHTGTYGGTCFGDSGGPVFIGSGGSKNIVGVTSQGDEDCNQLGYYARIEYVWDFVSNYIGETAPTCGECMSNAQIDECAAQAQACNGNAECTTYRNCVNGCAGDAACLEACAAASPGGVQPYADLMFCSACGSCNVTCQDPACVNNPTTGAGAGAGGGS
ncbi:MAG TPA: trypsin-like serine protease, partial [Acidimicrobiales bacterium]